MKFEQYRQEVMVTWNTRNLTTDEQFVNAALGLAEFGEIYEAKNREQRLDEIGDLTYYVTILANLFEMNDSIFDSIISIQFYSFRRILQAIFQIQGYSKKTLFHKKPLAWENNEAIRYRVMYLFSAIKRLCENNDTTIEEVFDQNISKLRKRHGSSFQYNTN